MTKTIMLVSALMCCAMTQANALENFSVQIYAAKQENSARYTSYSSNALIFNQRSGEVYRCNAYMAYDRKGFLTSGATCNKLQFTGDSVSGPGKYEFFGAPQRQFNASGRNADSHTFFWLVNQDSGDAYFCGIVPPDPKKDARCNTIKLNW